MIGNATCSREDLNLPQGKGFIIKNFLTRDETDELVNRAELNGFASIEWEYHKTYRDCTRVIMRDEHLAEKLWQRLLPHLRVDDLSAKPFGYGADGFWIPKGVNPLLRITRYSPGGHFDIHRDGGFVVTDDFRSVYTFMVYLQAPYYGGETRFYDSESEESMSGPRLHLPYQEVPKRDPVAKVSPKAGTAVIFTHDVAHEGATVTAGDKYVLRTDILFERTLHLGDDGWRSDPLYQTAENLYQDSIRLQQENQPRLSTEAYVKATEIHAKLTSCPTMTGMTGKGTAFRASLLVHVNSDIIEHLLPFLSVRDIAILMRTCRVLLYKCRSPSHFFLRYKRDFKDGLVRLSPGDQIITHDWFVLYGSRLLVEKFLPVVCVDIGSRHTKFASTQLKCDRLLTERWAREMAWKYGDPGPEPLHLPEFQGKVRSVFSRNLGHYWSAGSASCDLMVRLQEDDYKHWEEGRAGYGSEGYKFFPYSYLTEEERGFDRKPSIEVHAAVFLEILHVISGYCLDRNHAQNPIILAFPPFLRKTEAQQVALQLLPLVPAGFLGMVSAGIFVAARHRVRDAIVVSVGARFAWISVVRDLRTADDEWERRWHQGWFRERHTGILPTSPDKTLAESLAHTCKRRLEENPSLPLILTGGNAKIYHEGLTTALGLSDVKTPLLSDDPEMDVAIGGVVYASLPEVRNVLLKTPIVQKPDSWWSQKQKLNWDAMESALKRYRLPTLEDGQQKMWGVLENL
jgi:2-oxoglutarate-Fe(II)-dependent oxygenase superfamily protein